MKERESFIISLDKGRSKKCVKKSLNEPETHKKESEKVKKARKYLVIP
jgi:hypothetical protein